MLMLVCQIACALDMTLGPASGLPEGPDKSTAGQDRVEVWVVLSEPALATLPRDAMAQRTALLRRILAQQEAVMKSLGALGGTESARTQQMSNSIAIVIDADAVKKIRRIEGVISIRPVSHKNKVSH